MGNLHEPSTHASQLAALREEGNGAAWDVFIGRYEPLIREWCRRGRPRPGDEDELVQLVLVKLFLKLRTFEHDPSKRFRGWLRTVIRGVAADYWRSRQQHPGDYGPGDSAAQEALGQLPDEHNAEADALLLELEARLERDRLLHEACEQVRRRVTQSRWRAFWLTTVEGRRGEEVAAELGMTVGAVYVAKHHVTKLLRDAVGTPAARGNRPDPREDAHDARRLPHPGRSPRLP